MTSKSLKSEYQKWLWMLATADLLVVLLALAPGVPSNASLAQLGNWRLLTTVIVPIGVLLLVNVLPHKVKCMLVYWKPYGWLPGCEVFSKFAPEDFRIDMANLARNVGPLPVAAGAQNARWYQLYKQVESQAEVWEVHRSFLMYRDMATLSLPFIGLAPLCLYFAGASKDAQLIGASIFLVQFFLTALSARWSGIRFVCNVLAVHSIQKAAGAVAPEPRETL